MKLQTFATGAESSSFSLQRGRQAACRRRCKLKLELSAPVANGVNSLQCPNPGNSNLEKNLNAALQRRDAPLDLFFRDDDVDVDEPSLRRLLDLFRQYETPINLAVIPGLLTNDAADLLRQSVAGSLSLFELNQHGWRHLNHEPEGKKCEFGPSRFYQLQHEDIDDGKSRMNEAFGDRWFPVFVPPWNRCTTDTLTALERLNFHALSRDRGRGTGVSGRLIEIPITLDLFRWGGVAALRSIEELAQDFNQQIAAENRIGVMLHHKVMDDEAFALLEGLLGVFKRFSYVRMHTFQSLLNKPR